MSYSITDFGHIFQYYCMAHKSLREMRFPHGKGGSVLFFFFFNKIKTKIERFTGLQKCKNVFAYFCVYLMFLVLNGVLCDIAERL